MSELSNQGHSEAYPHELARLVRQRWTEEAALTSAPAERPDGGLPDDVALERLLSTCYQASLAREEGRPITFRIAFADPGAFDAVAGKSSGFHRLALTDFRPFDRHELRRLAPAAGFQHSLIGVCLDSDGEFRVWGLVHTGPRWLQAVRGGRRAAQAIPPILLVAVTGPGRVLVSRGARTIAALADGTLADVATDVFAASWLALLFASFCEARLEDHAKKSGRKSEPPWSLERDFCRKLVLQVLRRIVATVRAARHGGTIVVLPARTAHELCADGRFLTVKYSFRDEEPRRRISSLIVEIMDELVRRQLGFGGALPAEIGWTEYEATAAPELVALDDALFEVAHLIAMLADVDGAVVMTDEFEILGFGAEISGALPEVLTVDRSLDLDGMRRVAERTDRVGTRHRSAYRLCERLHDALVVVVSQDGGVRFVRWSDGRVTYFDQIATGPWEV
jgi:hypothetical protein